MSPLVELTVTLQHAAGMRALIKRTELFRKSLRLAERQLTSSGRSSDIRKESMGLSLIYTLQQDSMCKISPAGGRNFGKLEVVGKTRGRENLPVCPRVARVFFQQGLNPGSSSIKQTEPSNRQPSG